MSTRPIVCQHLGCKDDPGTAMAYPSLRNACHHVSPIATPNRSHQESICLRPLHIGCPVFNAPAGQRMPEEISFRMSGLPKSIVVLVKAVSIAGLIGMIVLGGFFGSKWYTELFGQATPSYEEIEQLELELAQPGMAWLNTNEVEDDEDIPTETQTELSPTAEPTDLTATLEDPLLALNTPIGKEIQFIIHRVAEGETTSQYAQRYNTSIEAINAVNYFLPPSLWINWLIIIPLDLTEVEGLPAFEAYLVEEDVTLDELAEQLSASLDEMCLYNGIDSNHTLHDGEWVLVPREPRQP